MIEAAQPHPRAIGRPGRLTFWQKPVAALGFIALADILFYWQRIGTTLGLFSLSLLAFIVVMRPDLVKHRGARIAAGGAAAMALVLCYDPSLLAFGLYWLMLTLAVLLPRTKGFDDGWRWARRLAWHWLASLAKPNGDRRRLRAAGRRRPLGLSRHFPVLVLPAIGSVLFLFLFARANPLIEEAIVGVDFSSPLQELSFTRTGFWLLMLFLLWSVLRPPRLLRIHSAGTGEPHFSLPGATAASVTLSLIAFNAIFAIQNGMDVAFLWSNAPLPHGMTLAEYAHRGAYPLIATALLAALFVLVTLRPGSEMAASPLIRRLVYAWIAQNVFLVASTIHRTLDYVDAYSLTRLRIAALIWMGLVAVGLFLICYRIWKSKSGAWLINANLVAALLALSFCSVVDLGRMAAAWNVRHAREAGGKGANLDICYLQGLGASALLPLIELEGRTRNPVLRERIGWARIDAMAQLEASQRQWRGWTILGALRLDAAKEAVAAKRLPRAYGGWKACGGPVPYLPLTVSTGR